MAMIRRLLEIDRDRQLEAAGSPRFHELAREMEQLQRQIVLEEGVDLEALEPEADDD